MILNYSPSSAWTVARANTWKNIETLWAIHFNIPTQFSITSAWIAAPLRLNLLLERYLDHSRQLSMWVYNCIFWSNVSSVDIIFLTQQIAQSTMSRASRCGSQVLPSKSGCHIVHSFHSIIESTNLLCAVNPTWNQLAATSPLHVVPRHDYSVYRHFGFGFLAFWLSGFCFLALAFWLWLSGLGFLALAKSNVEPASYIPAGQGAPKAWKRWGSSDGASKKCPSVVTITCLVFATMGVCPGLHQYQHPS